MYELDINEFKKWLLRFKSNDVVGWPRTSTHCPLSYFLFGVFGESVSIGPLATAFTDGNYNAAIKDKRPKIDSTGWADSFMKWVDSQFPRKKVVTALECLDYIDELILVESLTYD